MRTNREVYQLYLKSNNKLFIRGERLECTRHVWRSNDIIKKVMIVLINVKITIWRFRQRWINIIKSDFERCTPELRREAMVETEKDDVI